MSTTANRTRLARYVAIVVALAALGFEVVMHRQGVELVALVTVVVLPLVALVIVRSVWRLVRRPVGSVSVGEVVIGGMVLRAWERHRAKRNVRRW